jgi:hypothetical protein
MENPFATGLTIASMPRHVHSNITVQVLLVGLLVVANFDASSQPISAPSRTVFKCEKDGHVLYSDEPCPAAQRLQIEPTRGLTSTGKEGQGADVRNERFQEQVGAALKPLTGKSQEQYEVSRKRVYLEPKVAQECSVLDGSIPQLEAKERVSKGSELTKVQADLLVQRKRFRELRC